MLLTPEQKLWRAVLEQAYLDAEEQTAAGMSVKDRVRARNFLRAERPEDSASLAFVCDFAEVPADRVTHWARQRYSIAVPPCPAVAGPAFCSS